MANQIKPSKKKLIIASAVGIALVAAAAGVFVLSKGRSVSAELAVAGASTDSVAASELRFAVVKMDEIQKSAKILSDLRTQRERLEANLKSDLEKKQKKLEGDKKEIESQQGILSREALQGKVVDYQKQVAEFQREIAERAQAIDAAFQAALNDIQQKHLDPVIDALAAKKSLDLILDARFTRLTSKVKGLDITDEIISALDKKASKYELKVK
ncbi:MAG: OmpH family outer membrane protein [Rickettsiales bacterium]|jgi:Skp family chaperone for outer membrane proteins|nr:OmpH family outer membrane protein [Rickettsiales bacterium]